MTAALLSWVHCFRESNAGRQPCRADFPPGIGVRPAKRWCLTLTVRC